MKVIEEYFQEKRKDNNCKIECRECSKYANCLNDIILIKNKEK